ncbi:MULTISPECIES: hypothetical protein [unclassified Lysobacter]|uniref:hypothetical protein n=1 Tax=unclassified Lysobacter TaxID=2635362 RepID=UPI0006FB8C30|nr:MULTISPECIES: hypothetical protein [unclassified Lysobacter]KRC35054.1 hypothetical protein ASE10_10305 [Lysobacter sp. Root76]KRD70743.1 hypothetical protein ASE45_02475 [Lysobacter sp. Root96]
MCRFITATLPIAADIAALDAIARRHGRQLQPMANASIERQIGPGFRYFLTTLGHCDCGTPLGRRAPERSRREPDPAEAAQRLRRKGWSEAKIERAQAQQQAKRGAVDEVDAVAAREALAVWVAFLGEVLAYGSNARIGLLLHDYDGALSADIALLDREAVPRQALSVDLLERMREDVLYEFRR